MYKYLQQQQQNDKGLQLSVLHRLNRQGFDNFMPTYMKTQIK